MELQKTIIRQYVLLNQNPTLKDVAKDTGIQINRVFRLFNGSAMKLSEYQVFQRKIKEKMGINSTTEDVLANCLANLNAEAIQEIEIYLKRKMSIWKIKNGPTNLLENKNQKAA